MQIEIPGLGTIDLSSLSDEELNELVLQLPSDLRDAILNPTDDNDGPQTDDELHEFIKETYGLDIPRKSVCPDHDAPFQAFADLYFARRRSMLWMTNRGGAKTQMAALWHLLSAKFKKCDGISVGAIEEHAQRVYDRLRELLSKESGVPVADIEKHPDLVKSLLRQTDWKNGAVVEIVPGTDTAVNGPHHPHCHVDEQELMKPSVFQESRNISLSKGSNKAQDLITSTRKRAHGPMQTLVNDIKEAERSGFDPPYDLRTWCVFECVAQKKGCQVSNPDAPECDCPGGTANCDISEHRCGCDKIVKGKWESNEPRTFKDVCQGRCARAGGWLPLGDVHKTFRTTTRDVWEAQQECSRPSAAGLVIPEFDRERHCIRAWLPNPDLGEIFASVDFGGTNPHCIEFIQVLNQEAYATGYHQSQHEDPALLLPEGTRIIFDEVYIADIAPSKLADMALARVAYWRGHFPEFRVLRWFYDIQAKGARLEWLAHDPPIVLTNYATKDVQLHVTYIKDLIEDEKFYINLTHCQVLADELEQWHYPDQKKGITKDNPDQPVKDFDHAVDAMRYGIANIRTIERKSGKLSGGGDADPSALPASGETQYKPLEGQGNPQGPMFPRPPDWKTG